MSKNDTMWDDPLGVIDDDAEFTEEEMQAVESSELFDFVNDYADEIFTSPISNWSPDDKPFGWDITDVIDWESMDYE